MSGHSSDQDRLTSSPRADARLRFARQALAEPHLQLEPASADASFRSYWRTLGGEPSRIVMDAPPEKEDLGPWLDIGERLRAAGINAPEVLAEDRTQGFLLLSDLGTQPFLPHLHEGSVDALYETALNALHRMQSNVPAHDLPHYDEARLVAEMELLPTWFLQRHLRYTPECEEWDVIESAFRALVHNAQEQPQHFVHRDYHSRNLMIGSPTPGVIDFQDAVRGPITYDLVSLLRDCYIAWPESRVHDWVEAYRQRLLHNGLTRADQARFLRWFDLMGLQRHIKVLGIFCRLWYRDGKANYLNDLPLVWHYTRSVGSRYPETAPLIDLLERVVRGVDLTRSNNHIVQTATSCAP